MLREKQRLAAAKVKHAADRASYEARIADAAKASDGAALAAVLQECRKDNVTVAGNDPCVRFHIAAHDLLVRLCAAIPPPWFNMVRYCVLSSHSKHRSRVVPHDADPERFTRKPASGDQLELAFDGGNDEAPVGSGRSLWGWLLRHAFRADVETCKECGGPMGWVHAARAPPDIARLLARPLRSYPNCLRQFGARSRGPLAPEPPPERPPVLLGQLALPLQ